MSKALQTPRAVSSGRISGSCPPVAWTCSRWRASSSGRCPWVLRLGMRMPCTAGHDGLVSVFQYSVSMPLILTVTSQSPKSPLFRTSLTRSRHVLFAHRHSVLQVRMTPSGGEGAPEGMFVVPGQIQLGHGLMGSSPHKPSHGRLDPGLQHQVAGVVLDGDGHIADPVPSGCPLSPSASPRRSGRCSPLHGDGYASSFLILSR